MPDTHKVIVDRSQGSREQLTGLDEPPVELRLDTIMPPLRLAELCQFDQSRDLSLEHGKIRSTGAGVKVSLCMGALSRAKALPSFCQIYLPGHNLILPAPGQPQPGAATRSCPWRGTARWRRTARRGPAPDGRSWHTEYRGRGGSEP